MAQLKLHRETNEAAWLSMDFPTFSLRGYSRAAFHTFWQIPGLHLGFDAGYVPNDFRKTSHCFISHTHADHVAGLPCFLARRSLLHMAEPSVYVPAEKVEELQNWLTAFARLQEAQLPCKINGLLPGDTVHFHNHYAMQTLRTSHRIPSLGYVLQAKKSKLKPDLQGLSSDVIAGLARDGRQVSTTHYEPVLAFLGDSSIDTLDRHPELYEVPTLIMECTFLRPEKQVSGIYQHTHIRDILDRAGLFRNTTIILSHFSMVYTAAEIRAAADLLPAELGERTIFWDEGGLPS